MLGDKGTYKGANDKLLTAGLNKYMNTKRINIILPSDHKIVITKGWLLGYIERDGSFFLERTLSLHSLSQLQQNNGICLSKLKYFWLTTWVSINTLCSN